ncbi:hypothetical protein P20652_3840 [Pseudoalteromonas sp. BSi20652]|nr:hypothetical protein P20652_3840 [Pseudoalteromonas sp. BSi20652]
MQVIVVLLLKSITQYKSLLNQPIGRFTGTYFHRCYFLKGIAIFAK